MTGDPGPTASYFSRLDAEECWALLAETEVGRVAWVGESGIELVPVNYRVVDQKILFQTSAGGALARLATPTDVAFEVDDIDGETAVGWSVLLKGRSVRSVRPEGLRISWLDDERPVWIAITPGRVSGRVLSGTKRGGN